jgi:hypothetical protein
MEREAWLLLLEDEGRANAMFWGLRNSLLLFVAIFKFFMKKTHTKNKSS